ncbi:MAG: 2-succinyl-5-enolpyruvyl-6-hydroxy-3-cyclohexene-1-carboxylic-acid synthase [Tetrasphaera sp.]
MPPPTLDLARALLDEATDAGVAEIVVCPGSRSAPLAYAALAAAESGRVRLHVRVDERSAGFLALGLAKTSRRPALIVTTSGTALANLHPAVLEAHHACVPMLVVSADRPHELRHSGANQTTVQPGMFAEAVRWEADVAAPGPEATHAATHIAAARPLARAAYAAAVGSAGDPGPAHLNLCLREPLVPDAWPLEPPIPQHPPALSPPSAQAPTSDHGPTHRARTLVVLGDLVDPATRPVVSAWARVQGYPLIAEPFGLRREDAALPHGPLLLTDPGWLAAHLPERVLTVGRLTLSRPVTALLRTRGLVVEAITDRALVPDPAGVVCASHPFEALGDPQSHPPTAWGRAWQAAGEDLARRLAGAPPAWDTGAGCARAVAAGVPAGAHLFVGPSNPVRDLDVAVARVPDGVTVVANRGLAGIDGCLATAAGIAYAEGAAYALLGDLTFLHDANALLIGPAEERPDLSVVVVNDGGGGIFTLLEPGAPELSKAFDRLFGTPTQTDIGALCSAHGVPHVLPTSPDALAEAIGAPPDGIRVIEVRVRREGHRAERERLRTLAVRP